MTPIHDPALGSLCNDPALYEQAVTNFALNYVGEDNETWLRMALQAPLRFFSSLAHNPEPMTIIWDSGASASITLNKQDFLEGVKRVPTSVKSIGLAKNLRIEGVGKVAWNILDHNEIFACCVSQPTMFPAARLASSAPQVCFKHIQMKPS